MQTVQDDEVWCASTWWLSEIRGHLETASSKNHPNLINEFNYINWNLEG